MAAIAPWFCLCLPSCGPGFISQALHLCFFQFVLLKLYQENNENKQKEARIGPFKKIITKVALIFGNFLASLRYGTFKIKLKSVLATFWGIFCPLFILTSGHTSHRFSRTFTKAQHSTENGHPTSIHWSSLLLWSKNPLAQDASAIGRTLAHTSPHHHHHHQCSPINSSLKVFLSHDKREREIRYGTRKRLRWD